MKVAAFSLKDVIVFGLMADREASLIFFCLLAISAFLLSGISKSSTSAIIVFAQKAYISALSMKLSLSGMVYKKKKPLLVPFLH
mgnify:CR=1 FL=1